MCPDDGLAISNFIRRALTGKSMLVAGDSYRTLPVRHIHDLIHGIIRISRKTWPVL